MQIVVFTKDAFLPWPSTLSISAAEPAKSASQPSQPGVRVRRVEFRPGPAASITTTNTTKTQLCITRHSPVTMFRRDTSGPMDVDSMDPMARLAEFAEPPRKRE